MLSESTVRRLAFVKYLYKIAVDQSQGPEPLCAASILTFHDSVELFLQLASEHLDLRGGDINFMEYWKLLSPKLPEGGLTQQESMRRLNKSRVDLKHHGILPSRLDIESFRASVTGLFDENTPRIFGIEFGAISLVDLVQCEKARNHLEQANKLLKEGSRKDALTKMALAFSHLIDDYEETKKVGKFGRSPFVFGEGLINLSLSGFGSLGSELEVFAGQITDSLYRMQDALKIISLGLDYRKYVKFRMLTPYVIGEAPNDPRVIFTVEDEEIPSIDDCRFCFDFVIESAIDLQEFDFDVGSIKRFR